MKSTRMPVFVACLCAAALCQRCATVEAWPQALDRAAIEQAIAFGAERDPEPYLLRHVAAGRATVVVGAVYTPFLRVAFLSRAAALRRERVDPDAVDPNLTEPLAYVAFRWYCCEGTVDPTTKDAFQSVEPQVALLPPLGSQTEARSGIAVRGLGRGTPPEWIRRGTETLKQFGAEPTHEDIALVAAFPLHTLAAGQRFAIYKDIGTWISTRIGFVPSGVSSWR